MSASRACSTRSRARGWLARARPRARRGRPTSFEATVEGGPVTQARGAPTSSICPATATRAGGTTRPRSSRPSSRRTLPPDRTSSPPARGGPARGAARGYLSARRLAASRPVVGPPGASLDRRDAAAPRHHRDEGRQTLARGTRAQSPGDRAVFGQTPLAVSSRPARVSTTFAG